MTPDSETSWTPLCGRVSVAVRTFLAGRGERIREHEIREHLESCAACRQRYDEAVETIAHVGRARRRNEEVDLARAARIARRRRGSPAEEAAEAARRGRGHRLRLMLLPAAAILVATQLGRIGKKTTLETRPIATQVVGEVHAAGRTLASADGPIMLVRGQRCETGADGAARLGTGKVKLTLDTWTRVLIESPSRFRLEQGLVTLEGTCAITTSLGVLEAEGAKGTLSLEGARVFASVEDGTMLWIDPGGVQTLAVGPERLIAFRDESPNGM